jgi:hypothetical protein
MANLKILKTRIKSVRSTQKMTKAMKMVAASRLKKAKNAVEHSRPYAQKIREMIEQLSQNIVNRDNFDEKYPLLSGRIDGKNYLLLVISSWYLSLPSFLMAFSSVARYLFCRHPCLLWILFLQLICTRYIHDC